ncbi:MAG: UDP-N-acetylmuramoyl-L-alanine--D-glutamate ligase, partial [Candidatus Parabeggiatoa sp. nov. 3]
MGMGKTGIACVNFLVKQGYSVRVMDNRPKPPGLATLKQTLPQIPYLIGRFDAEQLARAREIIISPGLSQREPALVQALAAGVPVISEIELFARYVNAPVVAITGSNGKSTVTTLLGEMAQKAGLRVQVGGNLGTPALELLSTPAPDLYILELSSFQLEATESLNPKAAVVLNISEDHQDRYANIEDYIAAKRKIYQGDGIVIINADDPKVAAPSQRSTLSFSLRHDRGDFRVCQYHDELYLTRSNSLTPLLSTKKMRLKGSIMRANA